MCIAVKCMGFGIWQARLPVLASLLPSLCPWASFSIILSLSFLIWIIRIIPLDRVAIKRLWDYCSAKAIVIIFVIVWWSFMVNSNLFPNEVESWTSAVIIVSVSLGLHRIFHFLWYSCWHGAKRWHIVLLWNILDSASWPSVSREVKLMVVKWAFTHNPVILGAY